MKQNKKFKTELRLELEEKIEIICSISFYDDYFCEKKFNKNNQLECFFTQSTLKNEIIAYFKQNTIQFGFESTFSIAKSIGKGSFSQVFLVNQKHSDKQYAAKIFEKQNISNSPKGYLLLYNEIVLMQKLKNQQGIIQLLEVYETDSTFCFILPLIQGDSLKEYLRVKKNDNFAVQFMKQMLEILLILKKFHISHRDLKPDNILFTSNNEICLIDFGLATFYNIETYIHYKCGTPGYIAPEILNMNGKQAYSCQCDMFSLGAILYNLLTFKQLFKGRVYDETLSFNRKCNINYNFTEIKNSFGRDLLIKMLQKDPEKRITPEEALNHEYLQGEFQENEIENEVENQINQKIQSFNSRGRIFNLKNIKYLS